MSNGTAQEKRGTLRKWTSGVLRQPPTWSREAATIVRRTAHGSHQTPCDCLRTPGPHHRSYLHAPAYVIVTSSQRSSCGAIITSRPGSAARLATRCPLLLTRYTFNRPGACRKTGSPAPEMEQRPTNKRVASGAALFLRG